MISKSKNVDLVNEVMQEINIDENNMIDNFFKN